MTLADYIRALIFELGASDPAGFIRLQEVVGARAARIELDEEQVVAVFAQGGLQLEPAVSFTVEGSGGTDSATVLDLLDGNVEVSTAILDGSLRLTGDCDDIGRICLAIEILLSASARSPELQRLADQFRSSHRSARRAREGVAWYPFAPSASEVGLLQRLDLSPDS